MSLKKVRKAVLSTDLFNEQSFIGYQTLTVVTPPTVKLQSEKKFKSFFQTIKINPTYAVSFFRSTNPTKKENLLPIANKHKGAISNKAATKIRNAINWMLLFSEKKFIYSKKEEKTFSFYLNFITLTLPSEQLHSDDFIKEKMLVPFLEWITKTKGAFMWLWKAESQANGNIHFHITSHQFIHWKSVRAKWNTICAKHNYCKVFQDGSNDKGDSATQIKAAKNASQVGGYLANYISKKDLVRIKIKRPKGLPKIVSELKSDDCRNYCYAPGSPLKRPINGRLWACSNNIANINCFTSELEGSSNEFNALTSELLNITEAFQSEQFYSVGFYENLHTGHIPDALKQKVFELKPKRKQQTNFEVESLFN